MKMLILQAVVSALFMSYLNPATGQSSCSNGDARLVGGSSYLEGRVEVCSDGSWGSVCDDEWTAVDANVLCRQLGYASQDAIARDGAYFGQGSGSILLDDLDCNGDEDRLVDCSHNGIGIHDCSHYEDAGVTCKRPINVTYVKDSFTDIETDIQAIRLVNGPTANMGRLELLYNGTWGTVCDSFWSASDAVVACRMLGFDGAACAITSNEFGTAFSTTPFWMSNVQCTGTEDALDDCSFAGWGGISCSHAYNDAGVTCRNFSDIGTPYNVTLVSSTTRSITLSWTVPKLPASVQSVTFSISYKSEATQSTSSISYTPSPTSKEGDVTMYTLRSLTRNTEYSVKIQTSVRYSACSSSVYGNYSDSVTLQTNNTLRQSNYSVRLVSPHQGVDFMGRVEVLIENQWGTVCDNTFYTDEGSVVCGMLNYAGLLCVVRSAGLGRGIDPIWLTYLNCDNNDEILDDCYLGTLGNPYYGCGHYEDVGVICRPDKFPAVSNFEVKSVGPSSITISWTPYTSFPTGATNSFEVTYGYSNSTSRQLVTIANITSEYTLTSVAFEQNYTISIRARMFYSECGYYYRPYFYGEYSEVSARTIESAPSGPPSQFHIQAINETAIEAQWELPNQNERNGIIRGYKLYVQSADENVINVFNITNNNTLVYVISDREPKTAYTVSILAYTNAGDGPKSIHLTAVTRARNRSLITDFGLNGDGTDKVTRSLYTSSVNVHCTVRQGVSENTTVGWFFANGTKVNTSTSLSVTQREYNNGTTVLKIGSSRGLTYCEGGMYTCVANTDSGRSETRTFHLLIGSYPPTPSSPTIVKQSGGILTIGWLENSCDGGHIPSYFTVRYRRTSYYYYYSSWSYITVNDPTQRTLQLSLSSSTSYYFAISVTTTDAQTSSYSSSAYISTLSSPPSAPRSVSVTLVRPLTVNVSWVPYSSYRVSKYIVYATPVIIPADRRKRQTTTPHIIEKDFPSNVTSANITVTHYSVTYKFQVSAAYLSGGTINEGTPSSVTTSSIIFVPEPGLPKPAQIRISQTTSASLTLAWNYPSPPVTHTITGFLVTYSASVEWRTLRGNLVQYEDSGEVTVNNISVTLSPLIPGNIYTIKISAITPQGRGEEVSTTVNFPSTTLGSPAFFQLRMSPVVSCQNYLGRNVNITDRLFKFRSAIVQVLNRKCQGCGLTSANIRDDEFSCRGGLTNHIIYRAMVIGTSGYSSNALVTLLQLWVSSGTANIDVDSLRLNVDKDCFVPLDTLSDPDCPLLMSVPLPTEPTTNIATTTRQVERTTRLVPITTTEDVSVVSSALEGVLTTGDVGGIIVAIVIIALIVVLLVALLVIIIKWRSTKKPKSYNVMDHTLDAGIPHSDSNREIIQFEETDEHRNEEYTL